MAAAKPKPGADDKNKRISVYFGKIKIKEKGSTTKKERDVVINVVKRVQDALNLPVATKEQLRGELIKGTQTKSRIRGCKGSKSVVVENPTKPGKTLSFPVPGQATIDDIGSFLAKSSKAERFRMQGSWYTVESFK
jgi:hypothetical protein